MTFIALLASHSVRHSIGDREGGHPGRSVPVVVTNSLTLLRTGYSKRQAMHRRSSRPAIGPSKPDAERKAAKKR